MANYRRLFPGTSIDSAPQPSIVRGEAATIWVNPLFSTFAGLARPALVPKQSALALLQRRRQAGQIVQQPPVPRLLRPFLGREFAGVFPVVLVDLVQLVDERLALDDHGDLHVEVEGALVHV